MKVFTEVPQNIFECLMVYKEAYDEKFFSQVQSSIIKYALPGLGMPLAKKRRLTPTDIELAYKFMQNLSLSTAAQLQRCQEQGFEKFQVSEDNQRKYRFNLNKFLYWLAEQPWSTYSLASENKEQPYRFSGERHAKIKRKRLTNRENKEPYTLSFDPSKYGSSEEAVELERIDKELEDLANYLKSQHFKPYTIKMRIDVAKEFLGWLYKNEQVSLKSLSLSSIVKFTPVKLSISNFPSPPEYFYNKTFAQEKSKKATEESVKILERFFQFSSTPLMPRTKEMYAESALTIAKFLYREQTDCLYARNYEDIPVVQRLRILRNSYRSEAKNKPNAVPYEDKAVSWETALAVLERTRKEALMTHVEYLVRGEIKRKKRSTKVIAKSFMRFLLLAMLTLIPPDRQRTYRELQIEKTLKHGIWQENIFIPKDKMVEPSQAEFFIHLLPEDYKTGETYGEWLGKLPNTQFADGTTFYQYLELWLYGAKDNNPLQKTLKLKNNKPLREILEPKEHDYVFFGINSKKPMNISTFASVIKHLFERMTGVPVRPHVLRNMFRTYINEMGISEQESKSVAFWMKHDLRTANQYSRQLCRSKLAAGETLTERINKQILVSIDE